MVEVNHVCWFVGTQTRRLRVKVCLEQRSVAWSSQQTAHLLPLCRCNVQDYIWHKGARCESVVTEFQVTCLAVGASALVVLLLFMIVVCFAKKLHMLKTENKKLRKRR